MKRTYLVHGGWAAAVIAAFAIGSWQSGKRPHTLQANQFACSCTALIRSAPPSMELANSS